MEKRGILVSPKLSLLAEDALVAAGEIANFDVHCIRLPADPEGRLSAEDLAQIDVAFFSQDIQLGYGRSFFSAVRKAPNIKWMHAFNAGVDHPIFTELLTKGMRLSVSTGLTAVPIAQSAITGLLMFARGFPHYLDAQRRHSWEPLQGERQPQDLDNQTICILGLGGIGSELARLALGLGMNVIGIRRSPQRGEDPVDEMYPPHALAEVLPRCQWLAITCPLTPETRGLVDSDKLGSLPRGAHVINVARGEVVNEVALIEALNSGHLAGAYLDVFEKEPLQPESPLWDMPGVILSPHNAAASSSNAQKVFELFLDNFGNWLRGEALRHEVRT